MLALETGKPRHFAWRVYYPPSYQQVVTSPSGRRLWYSTRDEIEFIARVVLRPADDGGVEVFMHFPGRGNPGDVEDMSPDDVLRNTGDWQLPRGKKEHFGDKALGDLLRDRWDMIRVTQLRRAPTCRARTEAAGDRVALDTARRPASRSPQQAPSRHIRGLRPRPLRVEARTHYGEAVTRAFRRFGPCSTRRRPTIPPTTCPRPPSSRPQALARQGPLSGLVDGVDRRLADLCHQPPAQHHARSPHGARFPCARTAHRRPERNRRRGAGRMVLPRKPLGSLPARRTVPVVPGDPRDRLRPARSRRQEPPLKAGRHHIALDERPDGEARITVAWDGTGLMTVDEPSDSRRPFRRLGR